MDFLCTVLCSGRWWVCNCVLGLWGLSDKVFTVIVFCEYFDCLVLWSWLLSLAVIAVMLAMFSLVSLTSWGMRGRGQAGCQK